VRLHLFVDRTSIDIFGNDGALYMPMGMIVPANNQEVELYAKGGNAQLVSLDFYPLNSAWK
jgi:fructan beta-fructosidase